MRRRSLFAGLAGLLAAPKVAAAVPVKEPLPWPWISGDTVEFAAGGLIRDDAWALGIMGNDAPETILPLERVDGALHAVQRVTMKVDVEGLDGIRAAADAIAGLRQPEPIGIAWSGYTSEAP